MEIMKSCDANQGFNFTQDVQTVVGHLNSIKIGALEFAETFGVADPLDPSATVKVAGVMRSISWGGEKTSGIEITAQISNDNRKDLQTVLMTGLKDTAVEFVFTVYEYDLGKGDQQYFKCFHANDTALLGSIMKSGSDLMVYISDEPDYEVQQPLNYTMTITIVPEAQEMDLHYAMSMENKLVCRWGVEEA